MLLPYPTPPCLPLNYHLPRFERRGDIYADLTEHRLLTVCGFLTDLESRSPATIGGRLSKSVGFLQMSVYDKLTTVG